MKLIASYFFVICALFISFCYGIQGFDNDPSLYTRDKDQVVGDDGITDPLTNGTTNISQSINGIINDDEITSSNQAQNETLNVIKSVLNYFLGLLGLISLIYLLYHGIIMVTAAGDDTKYKKGFQGLKIGATAIISIGVSWFVISLIFAVIQKVLI